MHLKKLKERRAVLQEKLNNILKTAETEERAINEEETKEFDEAEAEIRSIDATIDAYEKSRSLVKEDKPDPEQRTAEQTAEAEERAFAAYIRGEAVEERAAVQMTKTDNGAVIPTSIANKIIEMVKEMCPIFSDAEHYNVPGTLNIPYYSEEKGSITMTYASEGVDGESTSGKFLSIELTGYLARAITEVSKSLINNSQFDIVSFVTRKMAEAISLFLEKECLFGTDKKAEGLKGIKQTKVAASSTAVTADELIDLQELIPDRYQANAYWIMSKNTRTAIRKLKDGQGNYLLNKDANSRWGYTLFGKDVYISDAMPDMAAGKRAIFYGDYKGLAVKVSENINIEVLRETKARLHLIEVVGFIEFDAKVQNAQMLAALDMKAAS